MKFSSQEKRKDKKPPDFTLRRLGSCLTSTDTLEHQLRLSTGGISRTRRSNHTRGNVRTGHSSRPLELSCSFGILSGARDRDVEFSTYRLGLGSGPMGRQTL